MLILQEAIIYIGYEITIHHCKDGLTSNTPKMLGHIFGDELYQTKADKIVKSMLLDYQRIVSDKPITVF